MIENLTELRSAIQRIAHFHTVLAHLNRSETDPDTHRARTTEALVEMRRLQGQVREWLAAHPPQPAAAPPRLLKAPHE